MANVLGRRSGVTGVAMTVAESLTVAVLVEVLTLGGYFVVAL